MKNAFPLPPVAPSQGDRRSASAGLIARTGSGGELRGLRFEGGAAEAAADRLSLEECTLRRVTLAGSLRGANLTDVRFEGCDLSNLRADGAVLMRVEFVRCKLLGLSLAGAVLNHVRFEGCGGRWIVLSGTRMRRVAFSGCDLTEAAMTDCLLAQTAFAECRFAGCDFSHTALAGIDLRGNELAGVRLSPADLRGAVVGVEQAADLLPLLGVEIR